MCECLMETHIQEFHSDGLVAVVLVVMRVVRLYNDDADDDDKVFIFHDDLCGLSVASRKQPRVCVCVWVSVRGSAIRARNETTDIHTHIFARVYVPHTQQRCMCERYMYTYIHYVFMLRSRVAIFVACLGPGTRTSGACIKYVYN